MKFSGFLMFRFAGDRTGGGRGWEEEDEVWGEREEVRVYDNGVVWGEEVWGKNYEDGYVEK